MLSTKLKKTIIINCLLVLAFPLHAEYIPSKNVKTVAEQFLRRQNKTIRKILTNRHLPTIDSITEFKDPETQILLGHIIHLSPRGFLIVTGKFKQSIVIAYTFRHNWNEEQNLLSQILRQDPRLSEKYNHQSKDQFDLKRPTQTSFQQWPAPGSSATDGWIQTTWHQTTSYNQYCPMDPTTNKRCVAGCVPTAMAQIIHFHKTIGNLVLDSNDQYISKSHDISIDQDSTEFDFPSFHALNNILENIKQKYQNNTELDDFEKAALLFTCGILVKAEYTSMSTNAYVRDMIYPMIQRMEYDEARFKLFDQTFLNSLKENMMNGLPANLKLPDHTVVADGYNTDGFFHINFGWGADQPDAITDAWYLLPDNIGSIYNKILYGVIDINFSKTTGPNLTKTDTILHIPGSKPGEPSMGAETRFQNNEHIPVLIDKIFTTASFALSIDGNSYSDAVGPITLQSGEILDITVRCLPDTLGCIHGDLILSLEEETCFSVVDLRGYGLPYIGTAVPEGSVSGNWTKTGSSYYIFGNIAVHDKLRIEPGVKIIFMTHAQMVIDQHAQLIAKGNPSDSILFDAWETWRGFTFNESGRNDTLDYCIIQNARTPEDRGGAFKLIYTDPVISHCKISNNQAERGGAFYIYEACPKIEKILICQNQAVKGGAIYGYSSSPILCNITSTLNDASDSGHEFCLVGKNHWTVTNTILWPHNHENGPLLLIGESDILEFHYSDIDTTKEGWLSGPKQNIRWERGNLSLDPLFTDSIKPICTLQTGSPCTDMGDPNDDIAIEPFPHGFRINMGAYGGSHSAVKTQDTMFTVHPEPLNFGDMTSQKEKTLKMHIKNGSPGLIHISEITCADTAHIRLSPYDDNFSSRIGEITLNSGEYDSILVQCVMDSNQSVDYNLNTQIMIKSVECEDRTIDVLVNSGTRIDSGFVSGFWKKEKNPYKIYGNITIEKGKSLIVEPGVHIYFMGPYTFNINAQTLFKAVGTVTDSILFCAADPSQGWGGLYIENSGNDDTLSYCIMKDGKSLGLYWSNNEGGAIAIWESSPFLSHSLFVSNQAINGGALSLFESSVEMNHCTLKRNKAALFGGAIEVYYSKLVMKNCLIIENKMAVEHDLAWYNGGAISSSYSTLELTNVILSRNQALHGGAISCYKSYILFKNSILWSNQARWGQNITIFGRDTVHFDHSNIDTISLRWMELEQQSTNRIIWGNGNIAQDPCFTNPGQGDYTLQPDSPCIDAGDPDTLYHDMEDPDNPDFALWPAMGTLRNDMGAFGGGKYDSDLNNTTINNRSDRPLHFQLRQNYPNPFNQVTTIAFDLPLKSYITITVYNTLGQRIKILTDKVMTPGSYFITWDGRDQKDVIVSSGIYFCRIVSNRFKATKKMVFIR